MSLALKHVKMFVLCIFFTHQSKKKIVDQTFKNMNEGIISKRRNAWIYMCKLYMEHQ